ncbi:MAG: alpha-L-rhamnosidase N-terminal domain-containing protein, partial [Anaerolineales bacterium]|nr:alpha-L-rhamnosidase N-terminal domain-containing protein [Anaerolineales bacterium]
MAIRNWPVAPSVANQQLRPPAGAAWIGSPHPFDLQEAYLAFRSPVFTLAQAAQQATFYLTADSRYKLWVNGQYVARGPARSFPETQQLDLLDISPFLQQGENLLAVMVYQPGYSHFSYLHRGQAGLLAWLTGARQVVLASDATWLVRRDASFAQHVPRVSIYGSGVEDREMARVEPWQEMAYEPAGWSQARVVAPAGGGIWPRLRPRSLPMLEERTVPLALREVRQGAWAAESDFHKRLARTWHISRPVPAAADNDYWPAELSAGESQLWLFELGQSKVFQAVLEVEGAAAGAELLLQYAEKMRDGALVISDPDTYCRVRLTDRFRLRAGDQRLESFALRGGRYLLVQLVGPAPAGFRFRVMARLSDYPLPRRAPLQFADEELNEIVALCTRTHLACLQDGFVDCVWRENAQWLGDALPQAKSLWVLSDDLRPLRQVLQMTAEAPYADGLLPSVVPGEVHAYAIPRYNCMWVELLAFYHQVSGDTELVMALWPALEGLLNALLASHNDEGLLVSPAGYRFYIDWSATSQAQPHAVYNLHVILALQEAAALATKMGQVADAAAWTAAAQRLQERVQAVFWRAGIWWDDPAGSTYSQLSAALALLTGSALPGSEAALLDAIEARSLAADHDETG